MATEREIRSAVEAFARREGSAFDATRLFAAWVLHTQHQLNVLDALAQTASSGGDDPLTKNDLADGYAIVPGNAFRPPQLLVLRAVFSSNETDVLQGLADLARSLNLAGSIAYHGHRLDNEGPRLRRLRETLDAMGIFDSEQVYRKVFAPDKLRSTTQLVGLFNLQQATRLALRDLSESFAPLSDLPLRSFQFPVFRLTAMWLAEHDPAWLLAQGDRVYRNAARNQLREATVKLLGPHHTKIQSVLRDIWGASDGWHDAYNARLLKQAVKTLGLSQSPFAIDTPSDP